MKHPPIRAVDYGMSGVGKTFFAGTFPTPIVAQQFDPRGKDCPYLDALEGIGVLGETGTIDLGESLKHEPLVVPYQEIVRSDNNKLLVRVEYYHEEELVFSEDRVTGWTALVKYRKRLNGLFTEEQDIWGTLIFDSTTSAELAFRCYQRYVLNPDARGEARKQWWGEATNELEMMLAIRFASWKKNLVVICHTDKDKASDEGGSVLRYSPRLPGRLSGDISTYYPEVYHGYKDKDGVRRLQTEASVMFAANSAIHAPDGCENYYDSLWEN